MCPAEALGLLLTVGWIALVGALVVGALAFLAIVTRPARAAAEGPLGRLVGRQVRARHGIAAEAPRWACRRCHSVNEPIAEACYACGAGAAEAGQPLPGAGPDDAWHAPAPVNRFDPSRYRGPGVSAVAGDAVGGEAAADGDPAAGGDASARTIRL